MARVRCENCGTEQDVVSATRATFCVICGDALTVPPELLGGKPAGTPPEPAQPLPRLDEEEGAFDTLSRHAADLPKEAPPTRNRDLEEITRQEKRTTTLLALIPGYGLWRLTRSTAHTPGEKLLVGFASLLVTVVALVLLRESLPTPRDEASRIHRQARERIEALHALVEDYRANQGESPDAQAWQASAETADLRFYDPWGRVFLYERLAGGYRIGTYGSDGQEGGRGESADLFVEFGEAETAAVPGEEAPAPAARIAHHFLERESCPAIRIGGAAVVSLHGGVEIETTCSSGGPGAIEITDAARLSAGDVLRVAAAEAGTGSFSPAPETGIAPSGDPLRGVPAPVFNGVTFTTGDTRGGLEVRHGTAFEPLTLVVDDARTIEPGVYWGGIRVVGGGVLTMQPGEYVIAGGGFSVYRDGEVGGSGVMIYNTLDPVNPNGVGGYAQFLLADSARVGLEAPGGGAYRGIVLFQDRNNLRPVELSGDSLDLQGLNGGIYAARAELRLTGKPGTFRANLVMRRLLTDASVTVLPPSMDFPIA